MTKEQSDDRNDSLSTHKVWPATFDWQGYGFDTRQVHAGEFDELTHGARVAPIYLTSAYRFDSFDQAAGRFAGTDEGQLYSRHLNPTNQVAEKRVAALEGGTGAVAVSSGQAAVTNAVLGLASAGQSIVSTASIYSGTKILFDRTLSRLGITTRYVWNPSDFEEWQQAISPDTQAIFIEAIPNPKNDVVDIAAIAHIAQKQGIPLIVDNTVSTPYLLRPLEHGADLVVHSSTKFLAGHGAALSGIIVDGGRFDWAQHGTKYAQITERANPKVPSILELAPTAPFEKLLRNTVMNDTGAALSPVNGFLLQQGIETLSLRLEKHLSNSWTIASWLQEQPQVESVDYAGLPGNPYYDIAQKYYQGRSGSVFSFTLAGGYESARRFVDRVQLFSRMTNIGDVRSMVLHPATTTHRSFTQEFRDRLGIGEGLLRLSVGIETVQDLLADLEKGLNGL